MSQVTSIYVTSALLAWGSLHHMSHVQSLLEVTNCFIICHIIFYFIICHTFVTCPLLKFVISFTIITISEVKSHKSCPLLNRHDFSICSRLTNVTNHISPVIYHRETQIQIHLSCLQVDNRGNRLIVTDDSDINTPAVAAAYAIKRYSKQAQDEISFEVRKCLVGRI